MILISHDSATRIQLLQHLPRGTIGAPSSSPRNNWGIDDGAVQLQSPIPSFRTYSSIRTIPNPLVSRGRRENKSLNDLFSRRPLADLRTSPHIMYQDITCRCHFNARGHKFNAVALSFSPLVDSFLTPRLLPCPITNNREHSDDPRRYFQKMTNIPTPTRKHTDDPVRRDCATSLRGLRRGNAAPICDARSKSTSPAIWTGWESSFFEKAFQQYGAGGVQMVPPRT